MNVCVIGAGAVGGYFGARLAEHGVPVTFLVRPGRLQQLQTRGLRVLSPYGDVVLSPQLAVHPESVQEPGLVLLAVKNYHLEGVLPSLSVLASRGAWVLPLLNGIRHLDVLRSVVPAPQLLGGTCHIEATLNEHGDVVHSNTLQHVIFGPLPKTDRSRLPEIETTLQKGGFPVKRSETVEIDMWTKYICLATLSGLTSAVRRPIGDILADPPAAALLQQFVEEISTIARAAHPSLPADIGAKALRWVRSLPPAMTSSMHRDLEKGLPLELESLQGVLLELAQQHRLPAPALHTVYALLHPYAHGRRP